MVDRCPCCQRPFEKMLDYPQVFVRRVEVLPIPEVMDDWSEEAARASRAGGLAAEEQTPQELLSQIGISRTQEVALAYQSKAVETYFSALASCTGQELPSTELTPPLEPDRVFKWAYPIPGTQLYLALSEAAPQEEKRVCEVAIYGRGPNLGSAGGPTLMRFGPVAAIYYEGRILGSAGPEPKVRT